MIPEKVSFTNYELNPREILFPRKRNVTPIPQNWHRIQFTVRDSDIGDMSMMNRWIEQNFNGRWNATTCYRGSSFDYVIYFEDINDAMMFHLKDGKTAFTEKEE